MADDIKVVVDARDLQLLRRELVGVGKDAKSSASVFEREFRKVENTLVKSARSSQAYYNETLKVDTATKSASQSARAMEAAFRKQDVEAKKVTKTLKDQALANRRLRMEYKEGYAAQVQLRLEQMRLNQARSKGIITDQQYKTSLANLAVSQDAAAAATSRTRRAMGHSSVITQQAGYQIGDFLVQVQSGTNAMVAFGQQATQVAGTLTILGGKWVLIGSALGILIPLTTALAAAFMRTRGESKTLEGGIDDLSSAISDYSGFVDTATMGTEDLAGKFGSVGSQAKEVAGFLAAWARIDAVEKMDAAVKTLAESFGGISDDLIAVTDQTRALAEGILGVGVTEFSNDMLSTVADLSSEFDVSTQSAYQLVDAMRGFAKADGVTDQVAATVALNNKFIEVFGSIESIPPELREVARQAGLIALQAGEIEGAADDISENFGKVTWEIKESVSQAIQLRDVMNQVASAGLTTSDRAQVLRAQIVAARGGRSAVAAGASAETAIELARAGATADQIARISQEAGVAAEEVATLEKTLSGLLNPKKESSKGANERESKLESFIASLQTERESLNSWYGEQQELLATFNESELEAIGGQAEAKLRLEQEYSNRLVQIKKQEADILRSASTSLYSDLTGLLDMFAGKSKAAAIASIALNKALAIAQAIQNTSVAVTKALIVDPTGILAARVATLGKIQVGIIAATGLAQAAQAGGGSGGGSGGGGRTSSRTTPSGAEASVPTPSAPQAQRVLIKGLGPKDLLTGEMLQELFDKLYDENQERGAVFMVST